MVSGSAWAGEETIDFSAQGYENGDEVEAVEATNFAVTFDKGTNSNAPKYYNTGTAIRTYGGNTFTVSSDYTITKITLTFGSGEGNNKITPDVGSFTSPNWTGSASSVTFTIGGASGHRRIQSITVTYDDGGAVVTKTLSTIALSGTYPTEFEQGDEFSHEGMTVTATYDDETTADVTSKATFSGYDLSSVGEQTVTVTYVEGEVTKTASYTIIVNEKAPVVSEDGVFDFTKENDYGTGLSPTNDGSYIEDDNTWTAGNVTLVTSGKYRWWSTDGTLRVYAPSEGNTTLTLSVPNGYVITNITITGNSDCKTLTANPGNYSTSDGYVWTGKSQTVVISRGDKNAQIKTITVTYEEGTSDPVKVDIATINSLTPTEVNVETEGTFEVDVTLAEGLTEEDYGISFTSSDENVILVDENTGEYTVGDEPGTVTITVRVDALDEDTYNNVEKTFEVTVKEASTPVTPVTDVVYTKVTSTADITDGQYLIVYEDESVAFDGSLETLDAVNNTIDVEINGNTITGTSETVAAEFTINVTEGSLKSASGYYVGVNSFSNGLKQNEESIYTNTFSIETSEEGITSAAINLDTDGGTMTMRFNKASNQNRFRYYKTGQEAIQLYKKQATSDVETIKVGPAGIATYVTKNAVEFKGVKAYAVTKINEKSVSRVELTSAPAGTPIIVEAAEGEYPCTIIESATAPEKNELTYSEEDVVSDGTIYALANKPEADGIGFYPVKSGVTVPAGKAYLVIDAKEVKGFLALDDVADAINNIAVETANGTIFNIAGQKVQNITKGGLYIVNGKKVFVK